MPKCDNTSCDNDATLYCSGCSDPPAYDHHQKEVYYCSEGCQSAHWPKHQFHCKVRQQRKKLLRVATLLQAMVEAYGESVLEADVRKIELREGDKPASMSDDKFNVEGAVNWRMRRAASVRESYTLPMSLLCSLAHQLLRGKAFLSQLIFGCAHVDRSSHQFLNPAVDYRTLSAIERIYFITQAAEYETPIRTTPRSPNDHPQIWRELGHQLRCQNSHSTGRLSQGESMSRNPIPSSRLRLFQFQRRR